MVALLAAGAVVLALTWSASAYFFPPKGAITVGGAHGQYDSISAALSDTSSDVYFIYPGNYTEAVYINRPNVRVYGQTLLPTTYLGNTVTISRNIDAALAGSNDLSGTVRVHAPNVSLYALNIENTFGKPVVQAQAIALSVAADQFGGYGLNLTSVQDTLLANGPGGNFFSNCLIQGSVDFIFGQHSSIWITESVLNTFGAGYITASGRASADGLWYVIDRSLITGANKNGTSYLGRPWRNFARVVFQRSYLDANINPAGWSIWSTSSPNTNETTYGEYENIGPGSRGLRANFSAQLGAPVEIATVLNSTSWVDPTFLKLTV